MYFINRLPESSVSWFKAKKDIKYTGMVSGHVKSVKVSGKAKVPILRNHSKTI